MEDKVTKWLAGSGDGYGDGDGYSSGDGDGDGSGYGPGSGGGYGEGDGYGPGSGGGSGDGYGSGYGPGNGDGYGSGSGYGSGYGSGDGDGYKINSHNGKRVYYVDDVPTIINSIHGNLAKGCMIGDDMQLTKCYIAKSAEHGMFAHGATVNDAVSALQTKIFAILDVDARISEFKKKFKPGHSYPGTEFYTWHNLLTGSCKMGRDEFIRSKGIDINAMYTPEQFFDIVKGAYGWNVISRLCEGGRYKHI
jgi:hypothetical protein